ncbi:hypothetical protein IWW38_002591, partial [Coemansia aciculifera]
MNRLDLSADFADYERAIGDTFASILDDVPVVGSASKDEYVKRFLDVVGLMRAHAKTHRQSFGRHSCMSYDISHGRAFSEELLLLQPGAAFTMNVDDDPSLRNVHIIVEAVNESGAEKYLEHLGLLADYALALWKCQPTRTFVPVLFLHAHDLDLLVFTRRGYYVAPVGPVLFERDDIYDMSGDISESLRHLWFLLTLPANKFGFLFDSHEFPHDVSIDTSSVPATI